MTHRPALHEDDRVVAVLARDGRRQSEDESSLCLAGHLFEAVGREVVALVHDQVAVVRDAVVDDTFPDEALNDGDVEQPGWSVSSAADAPNRFRREAEEGRESLDPLVEKLAAMNEDERVHAALGDQPRSHDGLAECRGRGQHAGLVLEHRVCGGLLFRPQLAAERDVQRLSGCSARPERSHECRASSASAERPRGSRGADAM